MFFGKKKQMPGKGELIEAEGGKHGLALRIAWAR